MEWRHIARAWIALTLLACGTADYRSGSTWSYTPHPSCERTGRDAGPHPPCAAYAYDGAPPACDAGAHGETRVYAVSVDVLPESSVDGHIRGFDLDGTSDPVCAAEDWVDGIDNQFSPFFASVLGELEVSRVTALIEVRGIDDLVDDECVEVSLYVGVPEHAPPPDGGVPPGETFDFAAGLSAPRGWRFDLGGARIAHSVLEAAGGDADWPMPVLGHPFLVPMHDVRLVAVLSDGGLEHGVVGGRVNGDELVARIHDDPTPWCHASSIEPILRAQSDLDPAVITLPDGGMQTRCAAMSAGIEFAAVPAVLSTCSTADDCAPSSWCFDGHCVAPLPDITPTTTSTVTPCGAPDGGRD